MANNTAQKQDQRSVELESPTTTDRLQVSRPLASTLKTTAHPVSMHQGMQQQRAGDQPLSAPAADRLLPEDDIASFFRNRAAVSRAPTDFGFGLKILFAAAFIVGALMTAYNYKPSFATHADRYSMKWFGFELSPHVPSFGPRAKGSARTQSTARPVTRADKLLSTNPAYVVDPVFLIIRNGQWSKIEAQIAGKCQRWVASNDCTIKGFYLGQRGMQQAIRPMLSVTDEKIAKLKPSYQAFWYLASALAAPDPARREGKFQMALSAVGNQPSEVKRILIDEMMVHLSRSGLYQEIPRYFRHSALEAKSGLWRGDIAKWRALASVVYPPPDRVLVLQTLLREERGSLRNDPRSISLLTSSIVRAGMAGAFTKVVVDAHGSAVKSQMDVEFRKMLMQTSVRLHLAQGHRAEAGTLLAKYRTTFKDDPFLNHFNASLQLGAGGVERARQVAAQLQPVKPGTPWETVILLGFALVRSNQTGRADTILQQLLATPISSQTRMWATMVKGEKLVAEGKFREAEATIRPLTKVMPDHTIAGDILRRALEGLGKDRDAQALRRKMDDVRAKKSYWSSPEMLTSPFGPMALSH